MQLDRIECRPRLGRSTCLGRSTRLGGAPASAAAGANGSTTVGSYESDAVPKAALQAVLDDCSAQTGVKVTVNTTDHGKFQNAINAYLQGTPDDLITWFSGERLNFVASKGLVTPIDDLWTKIGDQSPTRTRRSPRPPMESSTSFHIGPTRGPSCI